MAWDSKQQPVWLRNLVLQLMTGLISTALPQTRTMLGKMSCLFAVLMLPGGPSNVVETSGGNRCVLCKTLFIFLVFYSLYSTWSSRHETARL